MREFVHVGTTLRWVAYALVVESASGVVCSAPALARSWATDWGNSVVGVARVVDGDTLAIRAIRIRLEGIDAPEACQTCASRWFGTWKCGDAATRHLTQLVEGREVRCDNRGADKYRRMLAICHLGVLDLNAEMVRQGLAWAFVKYSRTYVAVEEEARARRVGIWQATTAPAWEYRAQAWGRADDLAPNGCAIKGNVSRAGHVYHVPWSPWYAKVRIDPARGERWFCSEAEAIAAGWRPASPR